MAQGLGVASGRHPCSEHPLSESFSGLALERVPGGTRLDLTHSGFTHANRWLRDQLAGGWRSNLPARRLPALLAAH